MANSSAVCGRRRGENASQITKRLLWKRIIQAAYNTLLILVWTRTDPIIGAGVAGLAAATALGKAGVPVIVLEARDRIGGRIFTQRDAVCDVPIKLGAEFIHGLPPEIWDQIDRSKIEEVEGRALIARTHPLKSAD